MTTYLFTISKRTNSTYQPSLDEGLQVEGIIKEEGFDIDNPVILYTSIAPTYNYLYAVELGRYYYIRWTYNKGMWEAHCELDAPATFKTQIGNTTAYVKYSSSNYDINVIDERVDTSESVSTSYKMDTSAMFNEDGCYIVAMVNNQADGNNGALSLYAMSSTEILDLVDELNADTWWNGIELGLENVLVNPMEFIVSCKWVPFARTQISGVSGLPVYAGYKNLGFTSRSIGRPLVIEEYNFTVPSRLTSHSFTDLEPYTTYSLYLPFVGNVNFDYGAYYPSSTIHIKMVADVSSGDISYTLSKDGIHPLQTFSGKCSVDYPLTATKSDGLGVASGILSTIGGGISALSGNLIGGTMSMASGFSQTVKSLSLSSMVNGGLSSRTSIAQSMQITLTILRKALTEGLTTERINTLGLALHKVVTINTLSGYVECVDASVSTGWKHINDLLNSMLNGGFYYE